jgi:hypothetical protein
MSSTPQPPRYAVQILLPQQAVLDSAVVHGQLLGWRDDVQLIAPARSHFGFAIPTHDLPLLAHVFAAAPDAFIALDAFDYPQAHFFHGVAEFNLGHVETAEKSVLKAQELDTRKLLPQTWHLLGAIAASRADYAGAADRMRTYVQLAPNASEKERAQLAEWESRAAQSAAK